MRVGFDILKSLNLRTRGVNIIACPTCSRQKFDVIATVNALEERLEDVTDSLDVAIIGCVVNGPGEAKEAQVGVTGGEPNLLYVGGAPAGKVDDGELLDTLERQVRETLARRVEKG